MKVERLSLGISRQDMESSKETPDEPRARQQHEANVALHYLLGSVSLVVSGDLSISGLKDELRVLLQGAGDYGDEVWKEAERLLSDIQEGSRRRGRPKIHGDSTRFRVCMLVRHFYGLGVSADSRGSDDEIAPIFHAAATHINSHGLGPFSAGMVKGIWDKARKEGYFMAKLT